MTLALAGLLALSAALHAAIIIRFGLKGNEPPAVFGVLCLLLAAAVWMGMTLALWAVLLVVLVELAGLVANNRKSAMKRRSNTRSLC